MNDDRREEVLSLDDPRSADPARAGAKAARLAALRREGVPVPDGFVVTVDAGRRFYRDNALGWSSPAAAFERAALPPVVRAALECAAESAWAVRSSAVYEDAAGASHAGLYDTVLDVVGAEALGRAARRCWAAIGSPGLRAYRGAAGGEQEPALALLVQRQLDARVAGVASSVDPLTGGGAVILGAVRGSGAPLLGGACDGEEWVVQADAICRRGGGILSAEEARAVASLARDVAARLGGPQEVEWAFEGDVLHCLQSRPLTGLPPAVEWRAPLPGAWLRHVRLGEWIGAPLTPLAATWLLPALERGASEFRRRWVGLPLPDPPSVIVHGWYFATVAYVPSDWAGVAGMIARMALHLARHPRRGSIVFMGSWSDPGTRLSLEEWDEAHVPRQERLVREGERRLPELDPRQLVELVDELVAAAGDGFGLLSSVCGAAWKAELLLAEHCRRHVPPEAGAPQRLLCGLEAPPASAHAVLSLDWGEPTAGELGLARDEGAVSARAAQAAEERRRARAQALRALAWRPLERRRFDRLLDRAVELSRQRSRCVRQVTRGWPLMRRALLAIGAACAGEGRLERAEDLFFLERAELSALLRGDGASSEWRAIVAARRAARRAQRRLTPPLQLGELPPPFRRALDIAEALRHPPSPVQGERLRGLPASPGHARGPVRVARGPDDLARLRAGEVLVVPLLAPAWVPLAAHAGAAVVDTGNHLTHACVLAREIGLPCVVGVGDATTRLRTGDWVSVDGASGTVDRFVA